MMLRYNPSGKTFHNTVTPGLIIFVAVFLASFTGIPARPASAQSIGSKVVSVHDSDASNWNHTTGQHWEYIDQSVVNNMFALGLMALTGTTNTVDAWNHIIPYQPGDEIAIKFNFNNSPDCTSGNDNQLDGLSETANAIIDGLLSIGVPAEDIWIYDAMRRVIPTRFILGVDNKNVRFFGAQQDGACGSKYYQTSFVDSRSPHVSGFTCQGGNLPQDVIRPAQVLVDAEHLINVPIFRSHGGMASFALKNHYGSVTYNLNDHRSMHYYFDPLDPAGDGNHGCDISTENVLADINNNPNIRGKTRLIVGEGIFGHSWNNMETPIPYASFNNDDPNIYFFGVDTIAVSSVMADSLNYERLMSDIPQAHWPSHEENHEQLHAGVLLGLGVHEHWDNPENKRYPTINYVRIDLDSQPQEPNISVTDSIAPTNDLQIPFGDVTDGSSSAERITIGNDGNASLSVGNIGQVNQLAPPFSISDDACTGQILMPGAKCTATIRFSPRGGGLFGDSFDVPSNDPDERTLTITVSGSGGNGDIVPPGGPENLRVISVTP